MLERRHSVSSLRREAILARRQARQAGLGTIPLIAILVGLGIVFITAFLLANGGVSKPASSTNQTGANAATDQGSYIRVPDNSLIYSNSSYHFSFAYPGSFAKLDESGASDPTTGLIFRAESAPAVAKPVGNTGAVLSGKFGVYVYNKSAFKILAVMPDIFVAPAQTGDSTTWKVVSSGGGNKDYSIGAAFPVKALKSQTGTTVFDMALNQGNSVYGRYVFADGDYYVIIALPYVSLPGGAAPSPNDLAAYNVIGANLASTVNVASSDSTASSNATNNQTNNGASTQPN